MAARERMGQTDPWWQISNPFSTIFTCVAERNVDSQTFSFQCLMFLGGLAVLLLFGCFPWMARQIKRFQPPDGATAVN